MPYLEFAGQMELDWTCPTAVVGESEPTPSPEAQTVAAPKPIRVIPKRSLREIVERYLRERGVPYINVDEAKRALFAGAKLRSFHFVVYRTTGQNWLLYAASLRKEAREDLRQWEDIFGTGFVAVVVAQSAGGALRFRTLAGESVDIT